MSNASDKPTEEPHKPDGLACPKCGCPSSKVYYTRRRTLKINGVETGGTLRRRIGEHCGAKFSTVERVQGGR